MAKKVFLGGTCNGSNWRNDMKILLQREGLEYFDPVVDDWNEEAQTRESEEWESCDFCLYTITPKMIGTYAIAEVVDDSNKRPEKTVFVMLYIDDEESFTERQWRSLMQVGYMVMQNGGLVFDNLKSAAMDMGERK